MDDAAHKSLLVRPSVAWQTGRLQWYMAFAVDPRLFESNATCRCTYRGTSNNVKRTTGTVRMWFDQGSVGSKQVPRRKGGLDLHCEQEQRCRDCVQESSDRVEVSTIYGLARTLMLEQDLVSDEREERGQ